MAVFTEWQGIRYIAQLIILNLVSCLACLSAIALAQLEFSEAVTGSVSFPDGAIACIGNLAVFFTSLLRGRLDLENGARDVLATNRGPKLREINGSGLTTCRSRRTTSYKNAKVVMFSNELSNLNSIKQFMKYIHHSHGVDSILLKCLDLKSAVKSKVVTAGPCGHYDDRRSIPDACGCIVLWTEEDEIALMIARRMPGTLKRLSDSLCLLPCWACLRGSCHGCDKGLLHAMKQMEEVSLETDAEAEPERALGEEESMAEIVECDAEKIEAERRLKQEESKAESRSEIHVGVEEIPCRQLKEESRAESRGEMHVDVEKTEAEPSLKEEQSKAESRREIRADVEEIPRRPLTEEGSKAESPAPVCDLLDYHWFFGKRACLCIPLCERGDDDWTRLMIRFMRSKDKVAREVRVSTSDAMEEYIDGRGEFGGPPIDDEYRSWSIIVTRLIEVAVNIVLTGWLRVDGLSSSLVARRVVRDHLVESKGTGFNANTFLSVAAVLCNEGGVCQLLSFRGKILRVRTLSYIVGSVNLICAMSWCVLMACEGRYGIHSMPPSKPRVVVMLAFIALALLMDFSKFLGVASKIRDYIIDYDVEERLENIMVLGMVLGMIVLEIAYLVTGSVMVVKGMGMGRWLYSAFQVLIWVKWGIGSYLLGDRDQRVDSHLLARYWWDSSDFMSIMTYSSAFMLNAVLAGVRGKWEY